MKSKKEQSNKASLLYNNQNLTNLLSIPNNVPVEKIDLSGNPIIDFTGMKIFPELHVLDCANTELISFNNFPNQEGIKSFICKKTPLCSYKLIYLMCAIVFGQSLEFVNGININQTIKSNALSMSAKIRPFLVKGWILQNLDPIKIIHNQTRQRKTFYFSFKQNDNSELDSQNDSNQSVNNIDNENDQDVYLEDDCESDAESLESKTVNSNVDNNINEEENVSTNESKIEIGGTNENETENEADTRLRERFRELQERILLEIKRPDIVPTIIKGGRVTVLSTYPSRSSSSLSSRQLLSSQPRAQTSLKNYSQSSKERNKKT